MPSSQKMQRVRRNSPCPVCGKPDWCLVAPDKSAAICARIDQGSIKRCGDAGWLHILRTDSAKFPKRRGLSRRIIAEPAETDGKCFEQLAEKYHQQLTTERLCTLSESLGVSAVSLKRLRIGWDGGAFVFPMSNDFGNVIGIKRRLPDGRKLSLIGSKTGLFIPAGLSPERMLLVCEGPTDAGAALDLGFDAIGRPNCNSRVEMTARAARGRTEIVIIADNDCAGKSGAEKLADSLILHFQSVKIVHPPEGIKDLRMWLRAGLERAHLLNAIDQTKPIEINITFND